MSYFGTNIKKIRGIRGLTQAQLAEELNLTRGSVSSYEEGRAEPKIETIMMASDFFGIPMEDLLKQKLTVNQLIGFKHPQVGQSISNDAKSISIMPSAPDFSGLSGDFMVIDTAKYIFTSETVLQGQVLFGVEVDNVSPGMCALQINNKWYIDEVESIEGESTYNIGTTQFKADQVSTCISIFGVYMPSQHLNLLMGLKQRLDKLEAKAT